jgi:hypothetical protein
MKKITLILITILILTALTACERASTTEEPINSANVHTTGQNGIHSNPNNLLPNNPTPTVILGEIALLVPNKWFMQDMTYFTAIANAEATSKVIDGQMSVTGTADLLLHVTDHKTGQTFVLCNRPNCHHNSEDCGALLPPCTFEETEDIRNIYPPQFFLDSFGIFGVGDYIYAHNGYNAYYRFNLDGSGRTKAVRIPDQYDANVSTTQNWLMNKKLYIITDVHKPTGLAHHPVALLKVLLEVDYKNGEVSEVWEQEFCESYSRGDMSNNHLDVLGGFGGEFYMIQPIYLDIETLESITLFSVNSVTANTEIIFTNIGDGIEGIAPDLRDGVSPSGFYFSKNNKEFVQLDFITRETTVLTDGFTDDWYISIIIHGYLIISNYVDTEGVDNKFINIGTGEVTDSVLPSIWAMEDDWLYMIVQSDEINPNKNEGGFSVRDSDSRYLVGRISVEDYFGNNETAIEEIGWLDYDELWGIRGE